MKIPSCAHAFVLMLLMASALSCASAGSSKLSKESSKTIVEGKTTKNEIVSLLGEPEQMLRLDKTSLDIHIQRISPENSSENMFLEGEYEVLTYSKWSYLAIDPLLFPSQETSKVLILVIDRDGICVKKLFDEQRRFEYLQYTSDPEFLCASSVPSFQSNLGNLVPWVRSVSATLPAPTAQGGAKIQKFCGSRH